MGLSDGRVEGWVKGVERVVNRQRVCVSLIRLMFFCLVSLFFFTNVVYGT